MFLPISKKELEQSGKSRPDFIFVSGDAYVDHPSFANAVIPRVLEDAGFCVAIISQPDFKTDKDITMYGEPKYGFLVSSGNMDSMVNHYSVTKTRRKTDSYTPGGIMGKRPDYATTVYSLMIKKAFPNCPVIIGGTEASLRRFGHYDYWSDSVKKSVLIDSKADILVFGMGEAPIVEIANLLRDGVKTDDITSVRGTCYIAKTIDSLSDFVRLPYYEDIIKDKKKYAKSYMRQYNNCDPFRGKVLVEPYLNDGFVVQNPPSLPLTTEQLDRIYSLDYKRNYHPSYEALGGVPAIEEVKFSLISSRGCFGACSFCALGYHQGRIVQSRSHQSLVDEAQKITELSDFKGYIHDVGGPTANFRNPACAKQLKVGTCEKRQCLFPSPCENLNTSHTDYIELLNKIRELPKVKKVFVRSGIRFDYLLADKDERFFQQLVSHHVSGQLKVAPEHVSNKVLNAMGKPENAVYNRFCERFKALTKKAGLEQYLVPYLMSSHPGSELKDAVELAVYLNENRINPEQVQDFYPTPSSLSTTMFYTGLDPRTMTEIFIPKTTEQKAMQRALIQFKNPKNKQLVYKALVSCNRRDLIGNGKGCLISETSKPKAQTKNKKNIKIKGTNKYNGKTKNR